MILLSLLLVDCSTEEEPWKHQKTSRKDVAQCVDEVMILIIERLVYLKFECIKSYWL